MERNIKLIIGSVVALSGVAYIVYSFVKDNSHNSINNNLTAPQVSDVMPF